MIRRAVGVAVAAAVCLALLLLLLAASRIGQQHRCTWLIAHRSPATSTYDCDKTGTP